MKPICLVIAGSDPTSGAGVQVDIRTIDRCGVHPFSVITAITYQTATEFHGYKSLSDELEKQLEVILSAYPVKYVKIGMIPDIKALNIIIDYIKKYELFVVLDPVTISSAGRRLSSEDLELEIEKKLFPSVKILTPNICEAFFYSNKEIKDDKSYTMNEFKEVASIILTKMHGGKDEEKAVIIKSVEIEDEGFFDLSLINKKSDNDFHEVFKTHNKYRLILKDNIHGTGCVFSSAIAAYLALGHSIENSIDLAETFFNEKFQYHNFIEFPDQGKMLDLTISDAKRNVINQIKEIYNFIFEIKKFSSLIPEVRMNISGSTLDAKSKSDVAAIEGRITIISGFPQALGNIKFDVSDHTARLLLAAKKYDNSINFVMNLKYIPEIIKAIKKNTDLDLQEIIRESQPEEVKKKEFSTMQWLIKECVDKSGRVPDIIWDKGSVGKEPMIRLFGTNSKDIIKKLKKIINLIE